MKVQLSPQMKGKALIRTEPNLCEGNVRSNRDGQQRCLLSDCRQDKGGPESEVRKRKKNRGVWLVAGHGASTVWLESPTQLLTH